MEKILVVALTLLINVSAAFAETTPTTPPENGTHKTYFESGALKSVEKYREGARHGAAKYYFEDGKLAAETNFKKGQTDGAERIYYENGNIKREAEFVDGKIQGIIKLFDDQGNLTNEVHVIDGLRDGVAKAFWPDKKVKEECLYKSDEVQTCTYFNEEGLLSAKSELDPQNPKRTIYLNYDKDGKVIQAQQSIKE